MKHTWMLDKIAYEIGNFCVRWGRIPVTQTKEKYGTIRVYNGFGIAGLHGLLFPNYVYKHRHFPKWLWKLDIYYISKMFSKCDRLILPYQRFIYKVAFYKAMWKYPKYHKHIMSAVDYPEAIGYEMPTLCDDHRKNYEFSYYWGNKENCKECKRG